MPSRSSTASRTCTSPRWRSCLCHDQGARSAARLAINPRITKGNGITATVRYCLGEGRHPITNELLPKRADGTSRVDWVGGTGFSFDMTTAGAPELARRVMEFDAINQKGKCRQVCVHVSLSWAPGQKPTREEMEEAARSALAALGMANAKALFIAHNDEDYAHLHIVASRINPATGVRYDLKRDWLKLSAWAEEYEREHGGVISLRRADMNQLRAAIKQRDAGAVLEAMTKQRSTFTEKQLARALQKEIFADSRTLAETKAALARERAQFKAAILSHPEIIVLAEKPGEPASRYTTHAVWEAETHVKYAAATLAANATHSPGHGRPDAIEPGAEFAGMTAEQLRAFRHVTAGKGLALIDGQAGTGKSFVLGAVREAYQAAGYSVVGLAPTAVVSQDMQADGFGHARTIHAELFALANGRTAWTQKTAVIVDEAAMVDTLLMALVTSWAASAGAKLILAGDDRQLSSIDRGGMFGFLKHKYGAAPLTEVKRQYKNDERRASEMAASGNFHDALGIYEQNGSIHWTRTQPEARAALVDEWTKDTAATPGKSRFVFAYTNEDVARLNAALRQVRKTRGELGPDRPIETVHGRLNFAVGDRIQFTKTDKAAGATNGRAGTIKQIDGTHLAITLDGREPTTINIDAAAFDEFRHGYAGTIYAGQGRTLDQTYLYHSEHWRSAPGYVALTRHREKTGLFVARNRAKNVTELARQMARRDDRRAASMFHPLHKISPIPTLTPMQLSARFAPDYARRDRERQRAAVQDNKPPPQPVTGISPAKKPEPDIDHRHPQPSSDINGHPADRDRGRRYEREAPPGPRSRPRGWHVFETPEEPVEWQHQNGGPDVPCRPVARPTALRRGPVIEYMPTAPAPRRQRQPSNNSEPGDAPTPMATPHARAPPAAPLAVPRKKPDDAPGTVATPQARAPPAAPSAPPRKETPKPLLKQNEPAGSKIGKLFRAAKELLTKRRPKTPSRKKSRHTGDDDKGQVRSRKPLHEHFPGVAREMSVPIFIQQLIKFFAAHSHDAEAMHTDPRYRDTLNIAADAVVIAPEITAPSLNL